jgi:hypothetical protein
MKNQLSNQLDQITFDYHSLDNEEIVIKGFMDRYDVSFDEAAEIFEETKKFLELAAEVQETGNNGLFIDNPLLIIDEMWHTFILHTKQYVGFCMSQFNRFIHHVPTSSNEKVALKNRYELSPVAALKESEEKLKSQYSYIYDKYGPETLIKWYDTLPQKYTADYIQSIKKA